MKHKTESDDWKGIIGQKIDEKVKKNVAHGEVYVVCPFMDACYSIFVGEKCLNVDKWSQTCTCHGWQMLAIPCDHAYAVIISIGQNAIDFVGDVFKFPTQELVYSGSFHGIETQDMPKVQDDGVFKDVIGNIIFSLKPPKSKRPPGRP